MSDSRYAPILTDAIENPTTASGGLSMNLTDTDLIKLKLYLRDKGAAAQGRQYTDWDMFNMYDEFRPACVPKLDRSNEEAVDYSIVTRCSKLSWTSSGKTQKPYIKSIKRGWISQPDAENDLDEQIKACENKESAEEHLRSLQTTIHHDFQLLKESVNAETHDETEINARALKAHRSVMSLYTATLMDTRNLPSRASDSTNGDK